MLTELEAKQKLVDVAQKLGASTLSQGTSGNLSLRLSHDLMMITPSGISYDALTVDDVCFVNISTGELKKGARKPSSETPLHTAVYRNRDDVFGIVHTHSLHATAYAVAGVPIQPIHYVIATIGQEIPVVPYLTYGTDELAMAVADALSIPGQNGALLANHGVLALGDNLDQAYYHAEVIEYLAQLGILAAGLGGAKSLPVAEIEHVRTKFAGYGQNAGTGGQTHD